MERFRGSVRALVVVALLVAGGCDPNPDGPAVPPGSGLSAQSKAAATKTAHKTNRPAVRLHPVD